MPRVSRIRQVVPNMEGRILRLREPARYRRPNAPNRGIAGINFNAPRSFARNLNPNFEAVPITDILQRNVARATRAARRLRRFY
jgi:hypothetical protein